MGTDAIDGLSSLVTDPNAQLDFINNNPFFEALANKSKNTLLNNQAASGKVGSGSTAESLQNSLLALGTDLVNQSVTQRQNLVNTGQNAAAQTGSLGASAAASISDLYAQQGNAQAAGIVGAQNANSNMVGNLVNIGSSIAGLCDVRMKENIKRVGQLDNGLPLYSFNYVGDNKPQINVMAQEVEETKPEFIIEHNGLKYVNTEVVHAN